MEKFKIEEWPRVQSLPLLRDHKQTLVQYRIIPDTSLLITLHFYHKQVSGGTRDFELMKSCDKFGFKQTDMKKNNLTQNIRSVYMRIYKLSPSMLRSFLTKKHGNKGLNFYPTSVEVGKTIRIKPKFRRNSLKLLRCVFPKS
jgi:hypothetical protein